jgi:hypothetical protein
LSLVKRVLEGGWAIEAAAEAAGMSKRRAYKWLRFKLEGAAGLVTATRGRITRRHGCNLKRQTSCSSCDARRRMTAAKIAAVLHLARSTVARLLPIGC